MTQCRQWQLESCGNIPGKMKFSSCSTLYHQYRYHSWSPSGFLLIFLSAFKPLMRKTSISFICSFDDLIIPRNHLEFILMIWQSNKRFFKWCELEGNGLGIMIDIISPPFVGSEVIEYLTLALINLINYDMLLENWKNHLLPLNERYW